MTAILSGSNEAFSARKLMSYEAASRRSRWVSSFISHSKISRLPNLALIKSCSRDMVVLAMDAGFYHSKEVVYFMLFYKILINQKRKQRERNGLTENTTEPASS